MPKSSKKDSAIKTFFKENKSLAFMLPLLVVLVVVLILVNSGGTGTAEPVSGTVAASSTPGSVTIPEDQPRVEVLPQIVRKASSQSETGSTNDPFQEPMKLSGVLNNSKGDAMVIIEAGGSSYIVGLDDFIGDTSWKVKAIYESSVMLDNNGESLLLKLDSSTQ